MGDRHAIWDGKGKRKSEKKLREDRDEMWAIFSLAIA